MPIVQQCATGSAQRVFMLVHGLPGDSTQMSPLGAVLESHGTVALVDLPDAGGAADDLSLDPDGSVDHVRELIAHFAPTPVTLVGLSYGAWVAARLASRDAPKNLARLVLLGGFAALAPEHGAAYEQVAADLEAGLRTVDDVRELAMQGFFPSHIPEGGRAHVAKIFGRLSAPRAARTFRRAAGCARADRAVGTYQVPATLLHARADVAVPVGYAEALAANGSRARMRILESDSHYLTLSHLADCRDAALGEQDDEDS